jgi:chromatin remodeling complex protein RSC6
LFKAENGGSQIITDKHKSRFAGNTTSKFVYTNIPVTNSA